MSVARDPLFSHSGAVLATSLRSRVGAGPVPPAEADPAHHDGRLICRRHVARRHPGTPGAPHSVDLDDVDGVNEREQPVPHKAED